MYYTSNPTGNEHDLPISGLTNMLGEQPTDRKEMQTLQSRSKEEQPSSGVATKIPGIVKRNTILLALSQALVGGGTQMVPALGPLLSVELIGSAAMAGAAMSIVGISRFVVAYPLGKITDNYGRRTGLMLGLIVAIAGTILTGFSVIWHSFPLFVLAMLIFGMGMGAAQQLRVAAADMYPSSRRAEGLGYVLTGSLVGAFAGPVVIGIAGLVSPVVGLSSLATPWLIVPVALIPTLLLISFMRPDPKEIAAHLDQYYPGYKPDKPAAIVDQGNTGIGAFLRHYPKRVAFVSSFSSQGTMVMIMAMTSYALALYGHALTAISISVSIHVLGMFAFSLPLGKLTDAFGRRSLLIAGTVITIMGTILVPISPEYWVITLGTFLVGLGWSCMNVASTAVIADTTQPHERGRAIGTNDVFASGAAIVLPFIAGPMVDSFGLSSIGILGVLLMVVPLPLLIQLREFAPGKYEDGSVAPERS